MNTCMILAMDFYYQGNWRMDWGLGNPNKTAALISCLMIACCWLATQRKRSWWALGLFTLLGLCLVQTFSRGGLVATFIGLLPAAFAYMKRRFLPGIPLTALLLALILLGGYALFMPEGLGKRIAATGEDPSVSNRLVLWKAAPRMMVDAPQGWGLGHSGEAYTQWYQPLSTRLTYRTLVNSHLTWLVEFGWTGRFFYLTGLIGILLLCLPSETLKIHPAALGIWLSFLSSAFFSSTAESPLLWILPLLALAYCLKKRWPFFHTVPRALFLLPAAASLTLLACFAAAGFLQPGKTDLKLEKGTLYVGNPESPKHCRVLAPDPAVLGSHYGLELRSCLEDGSARDWLWIFPSSTNDPSGPVHPEDTILLSGQIPYEQLQAAGICESTRILILNPSNQPADFIRKFPCIPNIACVIIGARREDARLWYVGGATGGLEIIKDPSAAYFIRGWIFRVVN